VDFWGHTPRGDSDASTDPEPSSVPELIDEVAAGSTPVPRPPPMRPSSQMEPPFVGRARHLALLDDAFELTRQGQPVAVHVQGDSGMGKTALLTRFLERVYTERDALVFGGRCYEHDTVAYKGIDQVVASLSQHLQLLPAKSALQFVPHHASQLARLFPAFAWLERSPSGRAQTGDPYEGRRRAFAALRELLTRVSEREPVVIALDDVQWADIDAAHLLAELMRGPQTPRLLLLLSYRRADRARSEALRMLLGEASPVSLEHAVFSRDAQPVVVRLLDVDALAPDAADELAHSLVRPGLPDTDARAAAIAGEAAGNPFFLRELARHTNESGGAFTGAPPIEQVIRERVSRLPPAARRLLEVTAVAGSPVDTRVALAAAALDRNDTGAPAVLLGEHLLRLRGPGAGTSIEPYHDRIRETVVAAMEPSQIEHCHRQLARALEASGGARPEAMVLHLRGAGDDAGASKYAGLAASAADAVMAFDRAADLHQLFLDMAPPDDPRRPDLEVKLGDAHANAGRGAAAAEAYLAAAARFEPSSPPGRELRRRAGDQYLRSGHIDEGSGVMNGVLASMGVTVPQSPTRKLIALLLERARLRLRGLDFTEQAAAVVADEDLIRIDSLCSGCIGMGMVDPVKSLVLHAHHLRAALDAGEPNRVARALAFELGAVSLAGSSARKRVEKLTRIARTAAQRIGTPYALAQIETADAMALHHVGDWRACRDGCTRALALLREHCTDVSWEVATTRYYLLWSLFQLGELTEHARLAPDWHREARERDDLYAEVAMGMTLSYAQLIHDEPEAARREVVRALDRWSHDGFQVPHGWAWYMHRWIDLYLGDGVAAWNGTEQFWPTYAGSLFRRMQQPHLQACNVRAGCALAGAAASRTAADRARLLRIARKQTNEIRRSGAAWAQPSALLLQASAAALSDGGPRAIGLLIRAADGFDQVDMPVYHSAARRRLGQLQGGTSGARIVDAADAAMRERGVTNPPCFTDMLAPGFFRR
jgi:hypothetical protein